MKKLLFISINLLLVIALIVVAFVFNTRIKTLNKEVDNYKKKDKSMEKTEVVNLNSKLNKNENIVFLGDSITEIYPIDEIYDSYQINNSGVSGYTTNDILDRMNGMLYSYNPTKVILLIGTNDIAGDISKEKQEDTTDNIKKICDEIKKNRPNAKIYIESIYPVNRNMRKDMVAERTNEVIQNMNKDIKEYCDKENLTYINMYDELTDENGNFDEKYTYDGLHPSTLGFAKITKVLMPYVYE